jgi:hypothetical protein
VDDHDAQLDSLRIRQVALLRRATYRSRSHAIIAAAVCAVAAVQVGWMAVEAVRAGQQVWASLGYLCGAVGAVWGSCWFIRKAMRLQHETARLETPPPSGSPDFSTLRDGSDVVQRLENIE